MAASAKGAYKILGSKFWALGSLNQKSKNNVLHSATPKTDGPKMARFHRETKRRIDLKFAVTDIHTYTRE